MQDLIKFIIALAFILGAFLVGKYVGSEKYSDQRKEMLEKISIDSNNIVQLQDSLIQLKKEVAKITSVKPVKLKLSSTKIKSK